MAHHYAFHPEYNLVLTTFSGDVTREDFVALYRALYGDPDYVPGMDELADLTRATRFGPRGAELWEVLDLMSSRYRSAPDVTSRTAIIAPADVHYGIGRMYEAIASETPEEVSVFRDAGEAVRWLRPDTPALLSLLSDD